MRENVEKLIRRLLVAGLGFKKQQFKCIGLYPPYKGAILKLIEVVKIRTQHVLNHNWVHCAHKTFP